MQVKKDQEELPEEFPVIEISAKNVEGIGEAGRYVKGDVLPGRTDI